MKSEKYITFRKGKTRDAFYIHIPSSDKKSFSKSVIIQDYPTRSLALKAAIQIRDEALKDIQLFHYVPEFPTVAKMYENKKKLIPLSFSTERKHDFYYSIAIAPKYGDIPLNKIKAADIQQSLNDFAIGRTDDTVRRLLSVWRQIYKAAQMMELPVYDRTSAVIVPEVHTPVKHRSVETDAETFLEFLADLKDYSEKQRNAYDTEAVYYLLLICYYTGCRPSEAAAITREAINFKKNELTLGNRIGSSRTETGVLIPRKEKNSDRIVPFTAECARVLVEMINWSCSRDSFVLRRKNGKFLDTNFISDLTNRVSRKYGLHFTSYQLRHLLATELVADPSVSDRTVQDLLGHASFSQTLDYSRSSEKERQNAVNGRTLKTV